MRRKLTILLLTLLVFIVSMSLIACKGDEELLATNGQVPVYQGMTISGNNTINNLSPRMAPDENASDVAKYIHGDHTGRDEDIDQETPFEEVPTIDQKTESTLSVVGSGAEIYYANKNQDIYITIKVLNPDSYEIVSFTLNGNKYTSYMFEEGSDLENLILKLNVGEAAGIVDYTIDAIKYIDGTDIKDVIIEGEKTIKAGISADDQTYVNVSNNVTTLNSISFNANLVDLYNLIEKSEGYAKAVLYDGVSIISTKELVAGENSITFDSLVPNKLYQYGIVVLYDNLSGDGIQLNTIYTNAEYTKTIVLFDDISVTQTGITFDYLWEETYENKTITSLSLFLEGEKVEEETLSTALQFSNLLSNVEYEIRASYLNLNQESETISVFFTTAPKATPELTIINPDSTQTSVSFEITETDTDSVGEITKIELIHGTDTPIEASTLDVRTFSDLLSNNLYTVKVTYVYNLNDGTGDKTIIREQEITTVSKATPELTIINPDSTQTSVSFEITETDTDSVGEITKIELIHGTDTPIEASTLDVRTFSDLLSNNLYTVKVTYVYNLNDGTGDKTIIREQEITTVSKATPELTIINPDSTQTSVSFEITETDTDSVGEITKIELIHGTDTPIEASTLDVRTFSDLLSNNLYTVKVTYVYNLNDGTGDKTIIREQEITTVSKATPELTIINPDSTQTSVSFEITETDTDSVGEITKIELIHGTDTPIEASTLDVRTFSDLLSNNLYTVKVTYVYNLNDGTGDKTIIREQEITTVSKATPELTIINPDSTQTSVSFEITETDTDSVGEITKIELIHGTDTPIEASTLDVRTFSDLLSNNLYTVKVTYVYNLNDGTGDKTIIREQEITTVSKATPELTIINPDSTQTSVSFEITETDTDSVGEITKIELIHGTDTPIEASTLDVRTFSDLLSNNLYTVKVTYVYNLNDGTGDKTIIREQEITTVSKATPELTIINPDSTQTSVSFEITETDTDSVGEITKIELIHGTDTPIEASTLDVRTFSDLLSNNLYTVKVTYVYNLNDGTGDKTIIREQEITTVSKATPELTIINPDSTQTSVSFEITETDTDSVGEITKIELIHGTDTPIEASTLDVRTFSDLLSNNLYTVKVTYVYNLNDGLGEQSSIVNLPIWTAPNLTFTQATCANTGPVSKGEIIYFEALVNNPNNVSFTKVKINGQYYNVSSGTSYSEIIVNMTVEDQFEGGNTDLTVTEIVGTLNGVERKMEVNENNTASVFVNGELNVLSIKIIDKNGREPEFEFVAQGEKYYCLVELANRTGYSIDSIRISGNTYSKYDQYFNSIDNNTLLIEKYYNAGWNSLELSSISYSNESVGEKTKEIVGIVTDSKLCLTNSTPIVISNATDLKNMNGWGYYVLESDIDLIGTTGNEWIDPGSFTGLFDGQGHKIINMKFAGTIENENLNWGLFRSASGIIRNVIVSGRLLVTITGGSASAGGIAVTSSGTLLLNSVGDDVNISINNISKGSMLGIVDNSFWRIGNIYYAKVNGGYYERGTLQEVVDLLEPFWDETIWDFEEIGLPSAKERYDITYNNLEGAQNHLSNLLVYTTRNEEIALLPPTKTGSIFLGWFDNELMSGSAVTDIPIGAYGNLQYYAKWEICNSHTFDDNCTCTKCGYIGHNEGADGYCSVCQSLISISKAIETYGYERAYEPIWIGGYLKTTVNYVWFGEYPQTIANSEAVAAMGTTPDSKGYYTSSYDNERYAKVVATPCTSGYTFSDSTTVISSSTYYFKVEPIKWRILSESDGKALILCESIIVNKRYNEYYSGAIEGVYANNYAESEVRAWLNDQFYNIAFTELQKSLIQTTEVDNSVYSTGSSTNPYACVNTNDKIFLPSRREVTNTAYGFINKTDRYKVTSDYSRATGAYTSTDDRYSGNGHWWLRSPFSDYSNLARGVNAGGDVYYGWDVYGGHYGTVDYDYYGVVPALTISLDEISDILLEKNIEEAGEVNGEGVFHFGQERTISATTNEGFTWLGWYDGETKVSTDDEMTYTFTVSGSDRTFVAKWMANTGTVSFNSNGGTGTIYSSTIRSGDTLPTNIFTNEGLYFAGWAKSAEGEVEYTEEDTYIVEENEGSYTLYAVWTSYLRFGSYIYFGEYPQTIANSEAVAAMGTTPDSNGYYTSSYDNERYAKVVATPYESGYTFSDSTTVNSSSTYYFKVEPIKWRILSESDGKALILCESIIVNKRFDDSRNNYAESEVRAWLNDQFYNIAFSELQKSLIQTTEVDNSVYSTGFSTNPYTCENTFDKIFLPSYREVANTAYWFINNTDRYKVTSDYSRATGAYTDTDDSYSGTGYWWLRSPDYYRSDLARNVNYNGYIGDYIYVSLTYIGVVPALTISLA